MSWNLLTVRSRFNQKKREKVEWTRLRARSWWMVPHQPWISTDGRFRSNHPQAGFSSSPPTHTHTHTNFAALVYSCDHPGCFFLQPSEDSCTEREGGWPWAAGRRYRKDSSNTVLLVSPAPYSLQVKARVGSQIYPSFIGIHSYIATLARRWQGTQHDDTMNCYWYHSNVVDFCSEAFGWFLIAVLPLPSDK